MYFPEDSNCGLTTQKHIQQVGKKENKKWKAVEAEGLLDRCRQQVSFSIFYHVSKTQKSVAVFNQAMIMC